MYCDDNEWKLSKVKDGIVFYFLLRMCRLKIYCMRVDMHLHEYQRIHVKTVFFEKTIFLTCRWPRIRACNNSVNKTAMRFILRFERSNYITQVTLICYRVKASSFAVPSLVCSVEKKLQSIDVPSFLAKQASHAKNKKKKISYKQ